MTDQYAHLLISAVKEVAQELRNLQAQLQLLRGAVERSRQ